MALFKLSGLNDYFPKSFQDSSGDDTIYGFAGNDTIDAGGGSNTVYGGADNDQLYFEQTGTATHQVMDGGLGEDTLSALARDFGTDTLLGGDGNDLLGTPFSDNAFFASYRVTIDAGAGDDTVAVQSSKLELYGGNGNDVLILDDQLSRAALVFDARGAVVVGHLGSDVFGPIEGFEVYAVAGAKGSNQIFLAAGDDDAHGNNSADTLSGGAGADTLLAYAGADKVYGGAGNDALNGGAGNDVVVGGTGVDTMAGGTGDDSFVFNRYDSGAVVGSLDRITDFVSHGVAALHHDVIDLTAIDARAAVAGHDSFTFIGLAAFTAAGQVRAVQEGVNTVVELNTFGPDGAEVRINLLGVTASTLGAEDFSLL